MSGPLDAITNLSEPDFHRFGSAVGFGAGFVDIFSAGEGHGHAALTTDAGFAEETHLRVGFGEDMIECAELNFGGFALHKHGAARTGAVLMDIWDWQAEDGSHMKSELAQILRDEGDKAGVVRTRRDFAEDHVIALDEHLNAEQAATTKRFGNGSSHVFGGGEGLV